GGHRGTPCGSRRRRRADRAGVARGAAPDPGARRQPRAGEDREDPRARGRVNVEPVTLEGKFVRLEPVRSDHLDALWEAGNSTAYPELWRYIPYRMRTRDDLRALIELGAASVGPFRLVFATIDLETGEAVGSTAFLNVDEANRRL